jgi:hypothetical protein
VKVRRIVSNIAASDIEAAKCFYHDVLGRPSLDSPLERMGFEPSVSP